MIMEVLVMKNNWMELGPLIEAGLEKGKSIAAVAKELGIKPQAIYNRKHLDSLKADRSKLRSVKISKVLTPRQYQNALVFIHCLHTLADNNPGKKVDVGIFMNEWRKVGDSLN